MDPEKELFELSGKFLSGNISEEEMEALNSLRKKEKNEVVFSELERIWKVSIESKRTFIPNVDTALSKIKERLLAPEPLRKSRRGYFAIGFSLLFAGICTLVILNYLKKENDSVVPGNETVPAPAVSMYEVVTEDSAALIELPDGTKVLLNEFSRLTYPERFDSLDRNVYLEGRALFDVSVDLSRKFLVHTKYSVATVTGTSFSLTAYRNRSEVEIEVISGQVVFSSCDNKEQIILEAGQRGILSKKDSTIKLSSECRSSEKFWWKKIKYRVKKIFSKKEVERSAAL